MRTIDLAILEDAAGRRGLSLKALGREAGISTNTMGKIRRGEPVRPLIARRLNDALLRIAELDHVESSA
jgi:transcriptional regulator with XRE-family HTH domain